MTAKKVVRKPAKAPAKAKAKTTTKKTVKKVAKPKTAVKKVAKPKVTPKMQLTAICKDIEVLLKKDPKSVTRAELTKALTSEIAKMKKVIAKM